MKQGAEEGIQMARTLNGEILIDDNGNLNESLWLSNLIACAELLKHKDEEKNTDGNNNN